MISHALGLWIMYQIYFPFSNWSYNLESSMYLCSLNIVCGFFPHVHKCLHIVIRSKGYLYIRHFVCNLVGGWVCITSWVNEDDLRWSRVIEGGRGGSSVIVGDWGWLRVINGDRGGLRMIEGDWMWKRVFSRVIKDDQGWSRVIKDDQGWSRVIQGDWGWSRMI